MAIARGFAGDEHDLPRPGPVAPGGAGHARPEAGAAARRAAGDQSAARARIASLTASATANPRATGMAPTSPKP